MDLKETYGSRFLIFEDESFKAEKDREKVRWWYYELRGKRGYVYPYSWGKLAVAFTSEKLANRLQGREGWKLIQNADDVMVFLVPDKDREIAFTILKLKKRRTVSDETKQKRIEYLKKVNAEKKDKHVS